MADLKDFVGKRILVKKEDSEDVFETTIDEVSPSGEYMREGESWTEAKEWNFVEELPPFASAVFPETDEEKPTEE